MCALISDGGFSYAYCDAGAIPTWKEENHDLDITVENIIQNGSVTYRTKDYPLELKPLFSAFGVKALAMTSLRSFLLFYLPLLEPRFPVEEDDDFAEEVSEEKKRDFVTPFQNSVKQIIREVSSFIIIIIFVVYFF